jgi:hypothetical protein
MRPLVALLCASLRVCLTFCMPLSITFSIWYCDTFAKRLGAGKLDRGCGFVTISNMFEANRGIKRPHTKAIIIAAAAVFAALAIAAGFFAWQFFSLKTNPNKENDEAVAKVTSEVGNLFILPSEKPTVAQVQDKEKLKGQTFFDKAENGDYILIYSEAKLALLYRQKDRKLVNVGPITVGDQNNQQTAAPKVPAGTTPKQ